MKRCKSFRAKKVFVFGLAIVIWGIVLLSVYAAEQLRSHDVTAFTFEGLSAVADYVDDEPATTSVTAKDGTVTVSTAAFESKTSDSGTCGGTTTSYTYKQRTSKLRIRNQTEDALKITYTLEINNKNGPVSEDAGKNKTVTIPAGDEYRITATSGSREKDEKQLSSQALSTEYTLTIHSAEVEEVSVDVTFKAVDLIDGRVPGSYEVRDNEGTLEIGNTYNKDINTKYTLVATENANYVFSGWYVNDSLLSKELSITTSFSGQTNAVEARFAADSLMSVVNLIDADAGETKYDYLEINSAHYHKDTGHSYHTDVDDPGVKDSVKKTYFADPKWERNNSTVTSTTSGSATGDAWTALGEQSIANVYIYSDVICVRALQDCNISFVNTITGKNLDTSKSKFYYYVSSTALSTGDVAATVKSKGIQNDSDARVQTALGSGQYLFIMSYGYATSKSYTKTAELDYSFTSKISEFSVSSNTTRYALNVSCQDNIGTVLGAGKIRINGVSYTISGSGNLATDYSAVAGAEITLEVANAPSNYVLMGWRDKTANTVSYTKTYTFGLNENHDIEVLFTPQMIIDMGSDGYKNASYRYKSLSGDEVAASGQFIARNRDWTSFYTTLDQAFSDANNEYVVLLAGDVFNGDFAIPSGKTLVIPYAMDDAAATEPIEVETSTSISGYCSTATLNGNVTVDGGILVSAKQAGANGGYPSGYIGRLTLGDSATLNVNGSLYAYGYVTGGEIHVSSSGVVHEFIEIKDIRNVTGMGNIYKARSTRSVFPFSNFYIKNIESTTVYESGAELRGHVGVKMGGAEDVTTTSVAVIGRSETAMFNLTEGTMTKQYDRTNDRLLFIVDEGAVAETGISTFKMDYNAPVLGVQHISLVTSDYYVPFCAGYGIVVNGSFTFNNKFKLLPGAMLSVGEKGMLTIAQDADLVVYRMNDYDTRASGKVADGEDYQGYVISGYPKYAAGFPGVSYATRRVAETTGSAIINVNGTVNVLGGLYVTDHISGSTNYDNGYNILTGTGTIILNNAKQSADSIYEAMQKNDTNDIEWDTVSLSALKALPYEATADTPENYTLTFKKDTYYGYVNDSGLYAWSKEKPVTLTYDANGGTGEMDSVSKMAEKSVTVAENTFSWKNYKFAGWNTASDGSGTTYKAGDEIKIEEDITLYAMWEKFFTVTWNNYDGTVLETDENVAEGAQPSYDGNTPTRPETEDYIYTFSGWTPELNAVDSDITYTAVFDELAKNVKVVHSDKTVTYYETVNEAITGSSTGETVVLLKDRTENVQIPTGKNLVLDLNGRNINAQSGIAIENNGTLSIVGNGVVAATGFGSAVVNNGVIEEISGGTYRGVECGILIAENSQVGTISGGTFSGKYAIQVAGALQSITNAEAKGTSVGVNVVDTGTIQSISGGSFEGTSVGLSVNGTVNSISGGCFISTGASGYAIRSTSSTLITFTCKDAEDENSYAGPLFKTSASMRETALSDLETKYSYPSGMTLSGKVNSKGYFYIARNVFTIKFERNDSSSEPATGTVSDWSIDLTADVLEVPTGRFARGGWIFEGWGIKAEDGTEEIVISADATSISLNALKSALNNPIVGDECALYAIWKPDKTYTINVTWSSELSYEYMPRVYQWDGAKLKYVLTSNAYWRAENQGNPTVTVSNVDEAGVYNGSVKASVEYSADQGYENYSMVFVMAHGQFTNQGVLSANLAPDESVFAEMKLEGEPSGATMDNQKIGSVKLTLTPTDG